MHFKRASVLAVVWLLVSCTSAPIGSVTVVQGAATLTPAPTVAVDSASASPLTSSLIPTQAPRPSPTPTVTLVPIATPSAVSSYIVGSQDTVSSIASYFGMTAQQLVGLNPGLEVNPDQLLVGDELSLVSGGVSKLVQARSTPPPAAVVASYVPYAGVLWTFDDCEYGQQGIVGRFIQVLKSHGIGSAIFFMTGQCFYSRPDLVNAIRQAGYSIGNHTLSHADLTKLSVADINYQIVNGPPGARYFRPPYGARNATVGVRIAAYGYTEMLWTASGGDSGAEGLKRSCSRILQDLVSTIRPNGVVLLHMFNPNSPGAVEAYLSGKGSC